MIYYKEYMSIYTYICIYLFAGNFFLIYWPEEESVTAVPSKRIVEPSSDSLGVGDYCQVKHARTVYEGKVAAVGKY